MCLTAHFIDRDWVLHKRILNFCPITSHKGEHLAESISNCLLDWKLDNVFTVTVDNASSNDVAVLELSKKLDMWGTNLTEGKHLHVRCMAHILNLIVQNGLKEIGPSIKKVRQMVKYVRSSSSRARNFLKCVEMQKIECDKMLSLDVPTRWNSTYLMLDTAEKFEKAFERFDLYDELLGEETGNVVNTKVEAYLRDLFAIYVSKYGKGSKSQPSSSDSSDSSGSGISQNMSKNSLRTKLHMKKQKNDSGSLGVKSELDKYLLEDQEPESEDFDILSWRKVNSPRFPVLSQLARDVLAISMSSVASECAFSTGGRILDPFRSSLTPKSGKKSHVQCLWRSWIVTTLGTRMIRMIPSFHIASELEFCSILAEFSYRGAGCPSEILEPFELK
uniref:HAT C-terminal dimerisation domain-containing protein n=1 Tax=Solanum lycopersicum TaxID=4081 RepID=A0A3Q7I3R1_SOLLC